MKKRNKKISPVGPLPTTTLIQLCSLVVHYEEYLSDDGHPEDLAAARGIRGLPEIKKLFERLEKQSLLPLRRSTE